MLVGSGSGKTSLISQYLSTLDKDTDGFLTTNINMSYYTDSKRLQQELELPIDKRSGRRFALNNLSVHSIALTTVSY